MLVDVFFKPVADKIQGASGYLFFPVGVSFFKGLKKLHGIEIAKGIGGEIADKAQGPMDVL